MKASLIFIMSLALLQHSVAGDGNSQSESLKSTKYEISVTPLTDDSNISGTRFFEPHVDKDTKSNQTTDIVNAASPRGYSSVYFGYVLVHTGQARSWRIENTGETLLNLKKTNLGGVMYSARSDCKWPLQPKASCVLTIWFRPFMEGYHSGHFEMLFDQGESLYFDLWGHGTWN